MHKKDTKTQHVIFIILKLYLFRFAVNKQFYLQYTLGFCEKNFDTESCGDNTQTK